MADRLKAWFADHSPGDGKAIVVDDAVLTSGIVGVGEGHNGLPDLPPLPEPGTTIPPVGEEPAPGSGDPTRDEAFDVFHRTTGFSGNEQVYGWTPPGGNSDSASLSVWVNFGVQTIVGWTPVSNIGALFNLFLSSADPDFGADRFAFMPGDPLFDPPGPAITDDLIEINSQFAFPLDGTTNAGWVHLMYAIRIQDRVAIPGGIDFDPIYTCNIRTIIYVNDTQLVNATTAVNLEHIPVPYPNPPFSFRPRPDPFFFSGNDGANSNVGGAYADNVPGGLGLYGAVTEYWLSRNFVDWTVAANRAKFHIKSLALDNYAPASLGSTGTRPGFGRPLLYLTGTHLQFPINRATGQSLLHDGTLIDVDSAPGT